MKAEIKEQWLSALRSGEYIQAQEALETEVWNNQGLSRGTGYCCLGVLAHIVDPEKKTWNHPDMSYFGGYIDNDPSLGVDTGQEFTDAVSAQCELIGGVLPVKILATMNDSEEKSFREIADWIEQNIETT